MSENNAISKNDETAIEWLDETIPVSTRFDDPYYSKADGLAETHHVFLKGNGLPSRFAACADTFTIAELGFGTGLNFLAVNRLWQKAASPTANLRYLSFERYPMSVDQMRTALSRWPELNTLSEKLLECWNPNFEFLDFQIENVAATVFFSDANIRLPQLDFEADAWFLDGFAPSKNPDLWSAELMREVYEHTSPGGSFATFTAAGWVRRNLQDSGFVVKRVPGHGSKREMMIGQKPAN